MDKNFLNEKNNFLKRIDKSRKGNIDKEIISLVDVINSKPNYYTTSSCSGRILLYSPSIKNKKYALKISFISHEPVSFDELKKCIKPADFLFFKMESFIIHVCCRTLKDAERLINIANDIGLRRCAIISLRKNIVELVGLEMLEAPVIIDKKLVIDNNYLNILVDIANKRLEKNHDKIIVLQNELEKKL
jgi:tRNA wybutosine-synthesizing protein 3